MHVTPEKVYTLHTVLSLLNVSLNCNINLWLLISQKTCSITVCKLIQLQWQKRGTVAVIDSVFRALYQLKLNLGICKQLAITGQQHTENEGKLIYLLIAALAIPRVISASDNCVQLGWGGGHSPLKWIGSQALSKDCWWMQFYVWSQGREIKNTDSWRVLSMIMSPERGNNLLQW